MNDELELQQYVDWLSLEYYDKRIKDYIDVRCTEDLRIGGEVSASWLNTAPVAENLNKLYIVTDAFTTGATFYEGNIECDKGTVVYLASTDAGLKYKLLARVIPADSSLSDAIENVSDSLNTLTRRVELLETDHKKLVDEHASLVDSFEDHKKESSYQFEAVTSAIQTTLKDIQEVNEDVADVREDIKHVSEDLQTLNHDIHDILHSHETRLNSFDNSFATKESVKDLEEKIDSIPQVSLDGYATEQYVQEQIAGIKAPDMSGYATIADVDAKVAALVDGAPAALNTLAELAEALNAQEDVLDTFATRSELAPVATSGSYKDLKDAPEIPSTEGLASESYVDEAIKNIPSVDLTGYAKKDDIPDVSEFITSEDLPQVPTKVSELENDAGYLTEHQSLAGLATEEFVQQKIDSIPGVDLSDYAKRSELPDTSKFLTEVPSEYVTESELEARGYLTEHQDLSDYAKKSDIPAVPSKVSELQNDAGYITDKELDGLATEEFVQSQIDAIPDIDTSNFASKSDLALKADKTYVDEALENVTVDLTGYATEDFVKTEIANAQLSGDDTTVDLSYLATKSELANETAELHRRIDELSVIQYGIF